MKQNKIYLKPYHSEVTDSEEGFIFKVWGRTKDGKGQEYQISIKFTWWWIPYLLKDFKRALMKKITYLSGLSNKIDVEI